MGPTQLLTRSVHTGCGTHPASCSERTYRLWGPPSFLLGAYIPGVGPTQLLARSVHTGCGAHPASYSERTYRVWGPPSFFLNKIPATLSPGGKAAGSEAHHWRPFTAGVEVYIHFLLCRNGVQWLSSTLLTQTPQELRDSTTCMVLSLSHSWQSYFFILRWVISAVHYVHFVLSLSMQLWRLVYRIWILLPPGIRSCSFALQFSVTCFIEEFRSALNVWGDSGFISRNASSAQRHDKMDILYNTVIEQVKKNLRPKDFDLTAGPCSSYFIINTG